MIKEYSALLSALLDVHKKPLQVSNLASYPQLAQFETLEITMITIIFISPVKLPFISVIQKNI